MPSKITKECVENNPERTPGFEPPTVSIRHPKACPLSGSYAYSGNTSCLRTSDFNKFSDAFRAQMPSKITKALVKSCADAGGWLVVWLAGWLAGWMAGWLADRLAGWLAGWVVFWT